MRLLHRVPIGSTERPVRVLYGTRLRRGLKAPFGAFPIELSDNFSGQKCSKILHCIDPPHIKFYREFNVTQKGHKHPLTREQDTQRTNGHLYAYWEGGQPTFSRLTEVHCLILQV